jgi:pSer/pThr/pTyr-binding forkhead associated (FHA) protein
VAPEIVGREGPNTGKSFRVGDAPVTFGRKPDNTVVVGSRAASRYHAEVRRGPDGRYVLVDLDSSNGTLVNGKRIKKYALRPGDLFAIGTETFCFEVAEVTRTVLGLPPVKPVDPVVAATVPVLNVTVSGGGPVGLSLALLLEHTMGAKVAVTVYDARWTTEGDKIVWKNELAGNVRRQQVVTVQSRQYLNLPEAIQERLFQDGAYSEMWPAGPDSVRGFGPRNVRIAYVEDTLLELANESSRITLVPEKFDPAQRRTEITGSHVLAICEGSRSRSRDFFAQKFGTADKSIYSLDGEHLQDVVLGLRVKSTLTDPMSVLLTIAQNRFLLNSLRGEGFLNMRLTDAEAQEVVGIDPVKRTFEECIAARPCVMGRDEHGDFACTTHSTLFLPALVRGSKLWRRVQEGLRLFGVAEADLSAVTAFRLDMVQRPRFTAELFSPTSRAPGTYGFLLGDAANAIHFWPGRGLNSGLASAISLARSLSAAWRGRPFRDSDFIRHEAAMGMLQYRHKSRGWKSMVAIDDDGGSKAIKAIIADSIETPHDPSFDIDAAVEGLMERLTQIRDRLTGRLPGLPDDDTLREHLSTMRPETLRTLLDSGAWDTVIVGGEEVDIDIFYRPEPQPTHEPKVLLSRI